MRATVIIATMNRSEQLENLTLKSLNKQISQEFDVIVWDASDDEKTKEVCSNNPQKLYYIHAPRKGLAKQRNDAVKYSREYFPQNEIIIFLDDDVIISNDAIGGVIDLFSDEPDIYGVGIPIKGSQVKEKILKKIIKTVFLNLTFEQRYMTKYAYGYQIGVEKNGTVVNWLSGCSMAYRTVCFDEANFNERLCLFGGYSLCEDSVFSSELYRKGYRFMLSRTGELVHVRDGNNRLDYKKMAASLVYNKQILFETINEDSPLPIYNLRKIMFLWNQQYNKTSLLLRAIRDNSGKDCLLGYKMANKAIKEDRAKRVK